MVVECPYIRSLKIPVMKVRLRFPNPDTLWLFTSIISGTILHLDLDNAQLTADLDEAEIELALNGFEARLSH